MRRFLFLTAALALAASGARAAENDIVFVDIEQVLRQSESGKRIQTEIDAEFQEREDRLRGVLEEIQGKEERLQKNSLTMESEARDALRFEIQRLRREFERDRDSLREDRNLRFQQRTETLLGKIRDSVRLLVEENKYRMVLDPRLMLYVAPEADVSELVIERLDRAATDDGGG